MGTFRCVAFRLRQKSIHLRSKRNSWRFEIPGFTKKIINKTKHHLKMQIIHLSVRYSIFFHEMSTNNEQLVSWEFSELILPRAHGQMTGSGNRTSCYLFHRMKWQKNGNILRELYCTSQDASFKVVLVGTWCADVQSSLASDQQLSSSLLA